MKNCKDKKFGTAEDGASLTLEEFEEAYSEPLSKEESDEIELATKEYNHIFGTENHSFLIAQTPRSRELFFELLMSLKTLCMVGTGFGGEKSVRETLTELILELRKMERFGCRE